MKVATFDYYRCYDCPLRTYGLVGPTMLHQSTESYGLERLIS